MPVSAPATTKAAIPSMPRSAWPDCRLCGCKLVLGSDDDHRRGLCRDCVTRPEARRFGPPAPAPRREPREFTAADRALIKQLHAHLPAGDLLRILNDRLQADVGDRHAPYTVAQLEAAQRELAPAPVATGWTALRRQLAYARREGVLARCTPQVVEDFCVAFSLAPGQAMVLKDIVRHAREDQ